MKALTKAYEAAARKGMSCRFLDNGDRTISDLDTGLMWEKKDTENGLHDQSRMYAWSDAMGDWLSAVNGHTSGVSTSHAGLAGWTDWRIPTIAELGSIIDSTVAGCGAGSTCINPVLGPTAQEYWSSSSSGPYADASHFANFMVPFATGLSDRSLLKAVRAVRGSL